MDKNLIDDMCKHIGETVTIFTKSGGESGSGFTGVLLGVNECYVRLITKIGPAPSCALGNCCTGMKGNKMECYQDPMCSDKTVGSEADIPVSSIVSFVHNAM